MVARRVSSDELELVSGAARYGTALANSAYETKPLPMFKRYVAQVA